MLHEADLAVVACHFVRGSSAPRASDLDGARRLREALGLCGIELENVYLFGDEAVSALSDYAAFYSAPPVRPRYRRGKHAAPEEALEGLYGEEVAAIYDVLNRSTIARTEPLLKAAEALQRWGPVAERLGEAEGRLSEQDLARVEALREYATGAGEDELLTLAKDYARQAAQGLLMLQPLDEALKERDTA